jgi:ActR/RegA family two-component response regulator
MVGVKKDDLFGAARQGEMTANELLSRYCTLVYAQTGSYEETARRLAIDRRTVKAKVQKTAAPPPPNASRR